MVQNTHIAVIVALKHTDTDRLGIINIVTLLKLLMMLHAKRCLHLHHFTITFTVSMLPVKIPVCQLCFWCRLPRCSGYSRQVRQIISTSCCYHL